LEAAMEWAFARDRALDALALAGAVGTYGWLALVSDRVGRWCARALEAAGEHAPARLRARALLAWADNARPGGWDLARLEAALEPYRAVDDDAGVIRSLASLANARSFHGDYEAGRRDAQAALERARALGDHVLIGEALAQVAFGTPRIEDAVPFIRDAV